MSPSQVAFHIILFDSEGAVFALRKWSEWEEWIRSFYIMSYLGYFRATSERLIFTKILVLKYGDWFGDSSHN